MCGGKKQVVATCNIHTEVSNPLRWAHFWGTWSQDPYKPHQESYYSTHSTDEELIITVLTGVFVVRGLVGQQEEEILTGVPIQ